MSRMQVPYEFFYAGLSGASSTLATKGVAGFYPGRAPIDATYGFIAYRPSDSQKPTATNDGHAIFASGFFDVEIVLGRDADVDSLADIEDEMMTLFDRKQFISTASGTVESSQWKGTYDYPYEPVDGTYPRRIMTFEIVVH